jgi:uncharacterized membrane protein YgcG
MPASQQQPQQQFIAGASQPGTFPPGLGPQPPLQQEQQPPSPPEQRKFLIDTLKDPEVLKAKLKQYMFLPVRPEVLALNIRKAVFSMPRSGNYIVPPLPPILTAPPTVSATAITQQASATHQMGYVPPPNLVQHIAKNQKWFQVSERDWYISAIGIWESIRSGRMLEGLSTRSVTSGSMSMGLNSGMGNGGGRFGGGGGGRGRERGVG